MNSFPHIMHLSSSPQKIIHHLSHCRFNLISSGKRAHTSAALVCPGHDSQTSVTPFILLYLCLPLCVTARWPASNCTANPTEHGGIHHSASTRSAPRPAPRLAACCSAPRPVPQTQPPALGLLCQGCVLLTERRLQHPVLSLALLPLQLRPDTLQGIASVTEQGFSCDVAVTPVCRFREPASRGSIPLHMLGFSSPPSSDLFIRQLISITW